MPFGTIMATGWASGLNLYGTALLLGIAGRLDWAETPGQLQHGWVLAVLAALYALEFVVDKVPWLDSAWDAIHTVVRPLGGALLGVAIAQDAGSAEVAAAVLGGGFSATAHSAKASTRALVNTSPEPFSNIVLSIGEDGVVAGVVALALAYPVVAGAVAIALAVVSVVVTFLLVRSVRRLRARWRERRSARSPRGPG